MGTGARGGKGRPKKSDAYIQWYVGDFLRDVMHLSTRQIGAYSLLIWAAYSRGGGLPEPECRTVTRLDADAWAEDRATLAAFFDLQDGVWWHRRVIRELEKRGQVSAARSAAAEAGNAARWAEGRPGSQMASQKGSQNDRKSAPPAPAPAPAPEPSPEEKEQQAAPDSLPGARETGSTVEPLLADWIMGFINSPNILRLDEIRVWRQMGAEDALIREVLMTVCERQRVAKHDWKPSALRYFTPAIEAALKARKTETEALDRQINEAWRTWEPRLGSFKRTGLWQEDWGGKPNSDAPNPAIPRELLTKFGFIQEAA